MLRCKFRKIDFIRRLIPTVIFFFGASYAAAQAIPSASSRYRISVVTLGKGDVLFSGFGHTGIVVDDDKTGSERLYNFGEFDYRQSKLLLKFLTGRLQFYTVLTDYRSFKARIARARRSLTEQQLALTADETAAIVSALDAAVMPENRYYLYHFYFANCTTKVRDLLDTVTDGLIRRAHTAPGKTLRARTDKSCEDRPLLGLVFRLILNRSVTRPIPSYDSLYLPAAFARGLGTVYRADKRPLVVRTKVVLQDKLKKHATALFSYLLIVLLSALIVAALGAPLIISSPRAARMVFGIGLLAFGCTTGALGIVMSLLWALTPYAELHANENLLLFPPTHFLFLATGIAYLRFHRLLPQRRVLANRILKGYLAFSVFLLLIDLGARLYAATLDNAILSISVAASLVLIYLSLRKIQR